MGGDGVPLINKKIPKIALKTPIRTPPGEPETINAWELMEGLEDTSPLRPPNHLRSFSFDIDRKSIPAPFDLPPKSRFQESRETSTSPSSMWLNLAESELKNPNPNSNSKPAVPEFDPEVISMFRNSLQELPFDDPFQIKDDEKGGGGARGSGGVRKGGWVGGGGGKGKWGCKKRGGGQGEVGVSEKKGGFLMR